MNHLVLNSILNSSTPHTLISVSKFFQLVLIRREADKNETINSTLDIFLVYIHIKVYWVVAYNIKLQNCLGFSIRLNLLL